MSHGQYAKAAKNNSGNQQSIPVQIPNVNLAASYHCPNCMNNIFTDAVRIWEVSALISPSGKSEQAKEPVLRCTGCGIAWSPSLLKRLSAKEREELIEKFKTQQEAICHQEKT